MYFTFSQSSPLSTWSSTDYNWFSTPLLVLFLEHSDSAISHWFSSPPLAQHWSIHSIQNSFYHLQKTPISQTALLLKRQSNTFTRSYVDVNLQWHPVYYSLKITDKSFPHHAPVLWKSPPNSFGNLTFIRHKFIWFFYSSSWSIYISTSL